MNPQVTPEHYFDRSYDSKRRFISYWHQIDEIINLKPRSLLEIGVGNGLVSRYLKQRGFSITTLDVDPALGPDIVGSVVAIPLSDNSFDVTACFEVLEHVPYEDFKKALHEIYRVSTKYATLSLPDCTRAYRLELQIPKIGDLKFLISLPRLEAPVHIFNGEHYWEIGKAGYPLRRILNDIEMVGFKLIKSYRVFEVPRHRFFILRKEGTKTEERG